MISKKNVWFMTLFSLIITLSVYYITVPSEDIVDSPVIKTEEGTILTALRVESDREMESIMNDLRLILSSVDASSEDKNKAYDKLKELNITRGEEERLEELIKKNYGFSSFVKINGDQIRVVVLADKHDSNVADSIMKSIQGVYDMQKYISVKFDSN